uniref:Uncharacterized protein n=1 Tax=Romanomermis culicivorax TaxID=13658 RepID=A0A915II69_ROMCU
MPAIMKALAGQDKHKLEEHNREWDDWVSSYNGSVYFGTPAISTTRINRINGFRKSNTDATL